MKVVISGYGKMGHMIEASLKKRGFTEIFPTEDVRATDAALAKESVCIDFTTPDAFRSNYPFLASAFKAVVVGTTGWGDIAPLVFDEFRKNGTTMIWASNFSIGVNAMFAAVQRTCEVLRAHGYTPHVDEIHHVHKLDAPSGTAKSLAGIVEKVTGEAPEISSFREGEVPGTHIVKFRSGVDEIVLSHEAFSREGFAEGAVEAAIMSEGLTGIHEFKELIL